MANRTAIVNARVEERVKKEAEGLLKEMGIPVSVAINMFYRQIISCRGLPFTPSASSAIPSLETMTQQEFDARMAAGLADAEAGRSIPLDDAFAQLFENASARRDALA